MSPAAAASSRITVPAATPLPVPSTAIAGPVPQSSSPAVGPTFLCEQCRCLKQFIGIPRVIRMLGVSRSTVYYWMDRGWIHWRLLPSGRRVICIGSLSSSGHEMVPVSKAL